MDGTEIVTGARHILGYGELQEATVGAKVDKNGQKCSNDRA